MSQLPTEPASSKPTLVGDFVVNLARFRDEERRRSDVLKRYFGSPLLAEKMAELEMRIEREREDQE